LKENEEKVVVEESFPAKTSPGDGGKGSGGDNEPPESSSSDALERWAIKFEQSVNIFLTVHSFSSFRSVHVVKPTVDPMLIW